MTLATGIEIAASGAPSLALGKSSATAHGATRQGRAIQGLTEPSASGAASGSVFGTGSFSSGWQSLLASLISTGDGINEAGTGKMQGNLLASSTPAEVGGGSSGTNPAATVGTGLEIKPEVQNGSAPAGLIADRSLSGAMAQRSAAMRTLEPRDPLSTKTEAKKAAEAPEKQPANAPRAEHSIEAAKPEAAAIEGPALVVPASIAGLAQAAPAPVTDNIVAPDKQPSAQTGEKRASQTSASTGLPNGSLPSPLTPRPSFARASAGAGGEVAPIARSSGEAPITQRQATTLPSSGQSLSDVEAADSTNAEEVPGAQASTDAESSKPLNAYTATPEPFHEPIQGPIASRESTQASVPGQSSNRAFVPQAPVADPKLTQSSTQSQDLSPQFASVKIEAPAAPVQAAPPPVAFIQDSSQIALQNQPRVLAPVANPSPAQSVAPKLSSPDRFVSAPERTQTVTPVVAPIQPVVHGPESSQAGLANPERFSVQGADQPPVTRAGLDGTSSQQFVSAQGETPAAVPVRDVIQRSSPSQASSQAVLPIRERTAAQSSSPIPEQPATLNPNPGQQSVSAQETTQALPQTSSQLQPDAPRKESTPAARSVERDSGARVPSLNSIQSSAPSQGLRAALAPAQSGPREPAADSNQSQIVTLDQEPPSPLVSGREAALTPAPQSNPVQPSISAEKPVRRFVSVSNQSQAIAAESNPDPMTAPEHESSQKIAPGESNSRTFESEGSKHQAASSNPASNPRQAPAQSLNSAQSAGPRPIVPSIAAPSGVVPPMAAPSQIPNQATGLDPVTPQPPAQSEDNTPAPLAVSHLPAAAGSELPALMPVTAGTTPAVAAPISVAASAAVPIVAGRPSSKSGGTTSTPGAVRPVRGAGRLDAARQGSPLAATHPVAAVAYASAVAVEAPGVSGAASLARESSSGTKAVAAPAPGETFEALDSESGLGKPAWVHSGTQRAEAGFEDPALGWVGVRAESGGGRVHAEVVLGSSDAAQALSGHLAGLNAYLAEHHTQVETLTVTAPESQSAGLAGDRGSGQGTQQGSGQQSAEGAGSGSQSSLSSGSHTPAPAGSSPVVFQSEAGGNAESEGHGGTHISVMA